jgi:hypothetical protein
VPQFFFALNPAVGPMVRVMTVVMVMPAPVPMPMAAATAVFLVKQDREHDDDHHPGNRDHGPAADRHRWSEVAILNHGFELSREIARLGHVALLHIQTRRRAIERNIAEINSLLPLRLRGSTGTGDTRSFSA